MRVVDRVGMRLAAMRMCDSMDMADGDCRQLRLRQRVARPTGCKKRKNGNLRAAAHLVVSRNLVV